ncbi:MAG: UDP-N-acetylmuramate--L-alanine ligase [Clostridia bacterium]|nr:UDP-N-acetylmuramate--L-alanine ligase [Clostridia bacterium]
MALDNTHFGYEKINEAIGSSPKKIFFAGVGGVSMSSLAKVCVLRGHDVTGYDRNESDLTKKIAEEGVKVVHESLPEYADEADIVVYTVAMSADDPVIKRAGELGKPLISRADFLGYVMRDYPVRVGVSGMHGKSTTTAITASVFEAAGREPTVFGGARMKKTGECNIIGGGECFVFEACEYMGSFLDFYPTLPVVLNIDMDHPDYFKSMDMIIDHFAAFMKKSDLAVVNGDDIEVAEAVKRSGVRAITFGRSSTNDYSIRNAKIMPGSSSFDITYRGEFLTHADMNVPGDHVAFDALAAAAAAHTSGVSPEAIGRGLSSYAGIMRRMEFVGKTPSGADVYDDYAHHPTELNATLKTAGRMGYDKLFVVFQPHTFSRTKELFDEFAYVLAGSLAEKTILAPIYPAREANDYGVTSAGLAAAVKNRGADAVSAESLEDAACMILKSAGPGDCVLVAGAGDIDRLPRMLTETK